MLQFTVIIPPAKIYFINVALFLMGFNISSHAYVLRAIIILKTNTKNIL